MLSMANNESVFGAIRIAFLALEINRQTHG
jgi:hypothetical protein